MRIKKVYYYIIHNMSFVCLAVLFLLFGAMFLFFRQKMAVYDQKLELLSETVKTMAGIATSEYQSVHNEYESSDESETCDNETCDNETCDNETGVQLTELEMDPVLEVVEMPKIIVSNDDVKAVQVNEHDGLSLKELKEKIAELNGPKLKTKKECLEYLNKL